MCDLAAPDLLARRIDELLLHHNACGAASATSRSAAALIAELNALAPKLLPYAEPVWQRLAELRRRGARILFEGAQGAMLDVDHGTYPFVTSSNTLAAAAALGAGTGADAVGYVLGITKAYTTRVGSGPFPTELDDDTGRGLGERGREFGTVTGRARRCGWFDAVLVRQAVKIGGIHGLALTKLDVLDGMVRLRICTAYRHFGQTLHHLPASTQAQAGSSRSTRSWTAGRRARAALAASPICRRQPLSMSNVWRSWLRRRLRFFRPARTARTRSAARPVRRLSERAYISGIVRHLSFVLYLLGRRA